MNRQYFANWLRQQSELLEILASEIENGDEDQSEVLIHIDMEKYIEWENGNIELT